MKVWVATALLALATPALAQTTAETLSTKQHSEEGEYLVSRNGFAVYMFKADTQGKSDHPAVSACSADCLAAWPPVTVEGQPAASGNVKPELLGTLTRDDGTIQVTYNGWPLYFYAEDYAPEDINGSDIEDFGEDWYLLGPNGNRSDRDNEDQRDKDDD
jgi:predicted lipoprotein with Yx(FWY)xxD motif